MEGLVDLLTQRGECMKRQRVFTAKNLCAFAPSRLCVAILFLVTGCFAQAPSVEKIDPPSWWTGSTINPVRILIRGSNLSGARIESATPGITASNFQISANGHY